MISDCLKTIDFLNTYRLEARVKATNMYVINGQKVTFMINDRLS